MKIKTVLLASIIISVFACSNKDSKLALNLETLKNNQQIAITDSCLVLPSIDTIKDTVIFAENDIIIDSIYYKVDSILIEEPNDDKVFNDIDTVLNQAYYEYIKTKKKNVSHYSYCTRLVFKNNNQLQGIKDFNIDETYNTGDIYIHKGDTIYKGSVIYYTYTTNLYFNQDGIYIKSDSLLKNCQIQLHYKTEIYNKTLKDFTNWSTKGLKFLNIEGNKYVYYIDYDSFESGHLNSLDNVTIRYYPEHFNSWEFPMCNEVTLNDEEFDKYCKLFKAHLM